MFVQSVVKPASLLFAFLFFSCRRKTASIRKSGDCRDGKLEWTLDTHLLTTHNEEPPLLKLTKNLLMQLIRY